MGSNSIVSIITPVYNAERYIEETMESVRQQTYTDWEMILVNDNSTDRSAEIIMAYINRTGDPRFHLVDMKTNVGAARARNEALSRARGRYIAYIDADDCWLPEKLAREIAFLSEKKAGFIYSNYEFINGDSQRSGRVIRAYKDLQYRDALKNTTIFTGTVMFDTDLIPKSELEMPAVKSEDTALWWKVLRKGYTAYALNETLVLYRVAGESLSSDKKEAIRRIWNLYRNVEKLSMVASCYYFICWTLTAVKRRVITEKMGGK